MNTIKILSITYFFLFLSLNLEKDFKYNITNSINIFNASVIRCLQESDGNSNQLNNELDAKVPVEASEEASTSAQNGDSSVTSEGVVSTQNDAQSQESAEAKAVKENGDRSSEVVKSEQDNGSPQVKEGSGSGSEQTGNENKDSQSQNNQNTNTDQSQKINEQLDRNEQLNKDAANLQPNENSLRGSENRNSDGEAQAENSNVDQNKNRDNASDLGDDLNANEDKENLDSISENEDDEFDFNSYEKNSRRNLNPDVNSSFFNSSLNSFFFIFIITIVSFYI